jgi:RNA polymerase sigma-70 factor (ECF subfamily)
MSTTQINEASVRACAAQWPALVSYAYGIVHNAQDAEDCVQKAFLSVWRQRAGFRGECKVRTWIYQAVKHHAFNLLGWRRRRCGRADLVSLDEVGPQGDNPAHDFLAAEAPTVQPCDQPVARAVIAAALAKLSPTLRRTLALADDDELSYAAHAARIGRPMGTVKSRIWRARAALAAVLAADGRCADFIAA